MIVLSSLPAPQRNSMLHLLAQAFLGLASPVSGVLPLVPSEVLADEEGGGRVV